MAATRQTRARLFHWGQPPTSKTFYPYALAIGQVAIAWNELQEALGLLFCSIMGGGAANQFLAIWQSLKADRAKRDLLLAAAKQFDMRAPSSTAFGTKLLAEVKWICSEMDSLEDYRNNAVHSPLFASGTRTVGPTTGLGNVRALRLAAHDDVLREFRWCRDYAMLLTEHVLALGLMFGDHGRAWPDRPKRPNRGDTKKRKQPRQAPPKEHPPPRRPSPE
jgi:hypothetical protein